jgi:hypothetical protein
VVLSVEPAKALAVGSMCQSLHTIIILLEEMRSCGNWVRELKKQVG